MKKCFIFGAAEGLPEIFKKTDNDLIIAADAGLRYLENMNIEPDIIMGDFDSLGEVPKGENIIRHPVKKDDTDTLLAVKKGFEEGCNSFYIFGGTGKRLDHTVANIQTLKFIEEKGGAGFLCGEGYTATVIKNRTLKFKSSAKGYISVFSMGEKAENITLKGLLYSGENYTLTNSFPLGVSNQFIGEDAEIKAIIGWLLIIWQGTADLVIE